MSFQKAIKQGIRLRQGVCGPTGSGKTKWGLYICDNLSKAYQTRYAVIDSERGSAKKYADAHDFDVLELVTFEPERYIDAIMDAEKAGYGVLMIDSLSHAWVGQGGVLDRVDAITKKQARPNSYTAWREGSKLQNELVDMILAYKGHIIVTLRTKMEYEQVKDESTGKTKVLKVGLQPVQRDGLEYEFDIVCDVDMEHELVVAKTRCSEIVDKVYRRNEADKYCAEVITWLGDQSTLPDKQEPLPAPDEKANLIGRIINGESRIYKIPKVIEAARNKYLATQDPSSCDIETLQKYFNHLWEKRNGRLTDAK